jgi:hypothetical protein
MWLSRGLAAFLALGPFAALAGGPPVHTIGSSGEEAARAMVMLPDGHLCVAGTFSDTLELPPLPTLQSQGRNPRKPLSEPTRMMRMDS